MNHIQCNKIPQGTNAIAMRPMVQGIGETHVENEVGMQNLDLAKVGMEIASVSSVFPTFSHAFFNAIQSHQIVQVIKQPSFKFHQG